MFGSIGGAQGIGGPLHNSIGGESFIRHIGNDKLIYDFKEGSGTTVRDKSHNNNNGTFGAGAAAPTWKRNSLYFDGGDTFRCLTLLDVFPEEITLSIFYKVVAKSGSNAQLFTKTNISGQDRFFWSIKDDNTMVFDFEEHDNGYSSRSIFSDWTIDSWENRYITWDNTNGLLSYKNGAIDGASSGDTVLLADGTSSDLYIYFLVGLIKEVRIWFKTLSQIEIQQNFLASKFRGNN